MHKFGHMRYEYKRAGFVNGMHAHVICCSLVSIISYALHDTGLAGLASFEYLVLYDAHNSQTK